MTKNGAVEKVPQTENKQGAAYERATRYRDKHGFFANAKSGLPKGQSGEGNREKAEQAVPDFYNTPNSGKDIIC